MAETIRRTNEQMNDVLKKEFKKKRFPRFKRFPRLPPNVKAISLINSYGLAFVDSVDYQKVNCWRWRLDRFTGYVGRSQRPHVGLHHFVLGKGSYGLDVDHENRCKRDNTRRNLRFATRSQNVSNVGKRCNESKSSYRGVSWFKSGREGKHWMARIGRKSSGLLLGYFSTEEEAARAYDLASVVLSEGFHGELNLGPVRFPRFADRKSRTAQGTLRCCCGRPQKFYSGKYERGFCSDGCWYLWSLTEKLKAALKGRKMDLRGGRRGLGWN